MELDDTPLKINGATVHLTLLFSIGFGSSGLGPSVRVADGRLGSDQSLTLDDTGETQESSKCKR